MTGEALVGLIMLLALLGAIFIGVPISFTLLFLAFTFGYFALGATVFDLAYFGTIGQMKEQLLAAVPLFIFMGFITEQAGLMERLFRAFRLLLAPIRGALYLVVILTATVFAMATGIVGAAVTVLGIMAAPIMIKSGYDSRLSAGAITAGGTLGILIPPSVMLIVMGPVLGVSVADLYAAAFGPGFLLASIYLVYLMGRSIINPKLGPPVPKEERRAAFAAMSQEVVPIAEFALGLLTLLGPCAYGVYVLASPMVGDSGRLALGCAIATLIAVVLFAALFRYPNPRRVVGRVALIAGVLGSVLVGAFAVFAHFYQVPAELARLVVVGLIGGTIGVSIETAFLTTLFQYPDLRRVVGRVALIAGILGAILVGAFAIIANFYPGAGELTRLVLAALIGGTIGVSIEATLLTTLFQYPDLRRVVGRVAMIAGVYGAILVGGFAIYAHSYLVLDEPKRLALIALIGGLLPVGLAGAFFESAIFRSVVIGVGPLVALITATLGSILAGLATPTEAAAIGAAGAFLLALAYGGFGFRPTLTNSIAAAITAAAGAAALVAGTRLALPGLSVVGGVALVFAVVFVFSRYSWRSLQRALTSTMSTSSMVLLLAVTSTIFGSVFARLGTANWITNTLLSFQLSPMVMLILVLILIFLLGWPFEWPAIVLVFLPIFYPVVKELNFEGLTQGDMLVWFGALVAVTLQTAFLSPPVAMSAYYLKQVVKEWSLSNIYKGMFQFMVLQVICIGLILYYPQIALWFPQTLQAAARAQKIPEDHQKIIDQQRKNPQSLEDDDWLKQK